MKNLFTILCLLTYQLSAQVSTFQQTLHGCDFQIGRCIKSTSDGGMIVLSSTGFVFSGCIGITRFDQDGTILWSKSYAMGQYDEFNSIIQTSDGGFVFTGTDGFLHLVKLDASGNILWEKHFSNVYLSSSVIEDAGNLVVAGTLYTFTTQMNKEIFLLKFDNLGNLLWSRYYPMQDDQQAYAIEKDQSGYFISGAYNNLWTEVFFIMNTDTSGNVNWAKKYSGSNYRGMGKYLDVIPGTGLIVSGNFLTWYNSNHSYDDGAYYVLKTDLSGNMNWFKRYRINNNFTKAGQMRHTNDGGFIGTGTFSDWNVNHNSFLFKTNATGQVIWSKYTDTISGGLNSFDFGPDGSIRGAGYIQIQDSVFYDVYVIKSDSTSSYSCQDFIAPLTETAFAITDSSVVMTPSSWSLSPASSPLTLSGSFTQNSICNTVSTPEIEKRKLKIFPNPSNGIFTLESDFLTGLYVLEISDVTGKIVFRETKDMKDNNNFFADLDPGIYILKVQSMNGVRSASRIVVN